MATEQEEHHRRLSMNEVAAAWVLAVLSLIGLAVLL